MKVPTADLDERHFNSHLRRKQDRPAGLQFGTEAPERRPYKQSSMLVARIQERAFSDVTPIHYGGPKAFKTGVDLPS